MNRKILDGQRPPHGGETPLARHSRFGDGGCRTLTTPQGIKSRLDGVPLRLVLDCHSEWGNALVNARLFWWTERALRQTNC